MATSMATKLGALAALSGRHLDASNPTQTFTDLIDMFVGMYDDLETLKTGQVEIND